ncbi:MAG: ectonucleotide pyrophosphatase/phosphodiesterase [Bacteroidales bacterium]|nr:ectonucleotide pyrophosphatase/phosphodiesterase [Bacteroidales bacterium]MDZ4204176.1 ectonucleotide pyrophosphatase/phosphodiesterase [Bacteroidales bacterium]
MLKPLMIYALIPLFFELYTISAQNKKENYLVVLSMDGFRWDYPDRTTTPTLDSIARVGIKAIAIRPSFPSKTFPNHYTLATGLHPDHHGLVNNSFYDPASNTTFTIRDSDARDNPMYYGGEPIWVTAEKQNLKTASFFWVGSEVPIQGIRPTYWKRYQNDFPFEQRIDTVIAWLNLPVEKRPRLIMWYMHEPDAIGHIYGPDDPRTLAYVSYLDSLVGVFCRKVKSLPHANRINLIFTSDHGMGNISPDRVVNLIDYVDESWVEKAIGGNPVYSIKARTSFADSIYHRLSKVQNIKVWKNGEMPAEYNYGTHPRTLDLIVVADSAWSIEWRRGSGYDYAGGTHGYDIRNTDMHAIFYANGPAFKKGHKHPVFDNIDLYPLMARILGLTPAKVDGRIEKTKKMLRKR